MKAVKNQQLDYVIELVENGVDIDICNSDGNTALWLACYTQNIYVLLALIEAGANINKKNANGISPLIYAASVGNEQMLELLLQAGCDAQLLPVYSKPLSHGAMHA